MRYRHKSPTRLRNNRVANSSSLCQQM